MKQIIIFHDNDLEKIAQKMIREVMQKIHNEAKKQAKTKGYTVKAVKNYLYYKVLKSED